MRTENDIDPALRTYITSQILPMYVHFDPAHRTDHVQKVIVESLAMASRFEVLPNMVYTIAAYHDVGLVEGREKHHEVSGTMLRSDTQLSKWFSPEQIETMAQAVEDHRASAQRPPRSIYGCIVAEADRDIEGDTIISRTIQFGFKHYPDLDREGHIARAIAHLHEKYGRGGYLKLWIPWSENAVRLNALQDIIADPDALLLRITYKLDEYSTD
jgi:uncharacterized protein